MGSINKIRKKVKKLYAGGKYSKVIQLCTHYLSIHPDDLLALNDLASAYNLKGDYTKAIKSAVKTLELDEKNKVAFDNLFFAYDKLKDYDNAFKILEQYLKICKSSEEMLSHLPFEIINFSEDDARKL